MKEFCGDDTQLVARIYKVASGGTIGYNIVTGEFEADLERQYKRIEGYSTFRGWMTKVIPYDDYRDIMDSFDKIPLPAEEILQAKLDHLKATVAEARKKYHAALDTYLKAIPDGAAREAAADEEASI